MGRPIGKRVALRKSVWNVSRSEYFTILLTYEKVKTITYNLTTAVSVAGIGINHANWCEIPITYFMRSNGSFCVKCHVTPEL